MHSHPGHIVLRSNWWGLLMISCLLRFPSIFLYLQTSFDANFIYLMIVVDAFLNIWYCWLKVRFGICVHPLSVHTSVDGSVDEIPLPLKRQILRYVALLCDTLLDLKIMMPISYFLISSKRFKRGCKVNFYSIRQQNIQ